MTRVHSVKKKEEELARRETASLEKVWTFGTSNKKLKPQEKTTKKRMNKVWSLSWKSSDNSGEFVILKGSDRLYLIKMYAEGLRDKEKDVVSLQSCSDPEEGHFAHSSKGKSGLVKSQENFEATFISYL